MTCGEWLQVGGGVAELFGLLTVATGIAASRERFTDKPSLLARMGAFFDRGLYWLWKKFDRKATQQVGTIQFQFQGIGSGELFGEPTVIKGYAGTPEQQIQDMKNRIQEQTERVDQLEKKLRTEAEARAKGDKDLETEIARSKNELGELVGEVVAGGLRLETFGVLLFAAGVALTIAGVAAS